MPCRYAIKGGLPLGTAGVPTYNNSSKRQSHSSGRSINKRQGGRRQPIFGGRSCSLWAAPAADGDVCRPQKAASPPKIAATPTDGADVDICRPQNLTAGLVHHAQLQGQTGTSAAHRNSARQKRLSRRFLVAIGIAPNILPNSHSSRYSKCHREGMRAIEITRIRECAGVKPIFRH